MDTPPQRWNQPAWQGPSPEAHDASFDELIAAARARFGGLVGALTVQALIAVVGVLPMLPSPGRGFWGVLAGFGLMTATILFFAARPGTPSDLPQVGRLVIAVAFGAVPIVAFMVGVGRFIADAFRQSAEAGLSSVIMATFYGTVFFGLPTLVLSVRPVRNVRS
jgi:hypothetical protein